MKRGNIRISVDLDNIDELVDDIQEDIDDVVAETVSEVALMGKNTAQDHIRKHDRVWNKDLLHNWIPIREKTQFGTHVTGYQNFSRHAAAIDEGARYSDEKPNWGNLRDYVVSEYPHVVAQGPNKVDWVTTQLQDTIYRNGIRGIDYTGAAENKMINILEPTFQKNWSKQR